MVTDNLESFIEELVANLNDQNIDVSNFELDHFGYQSSSKQDYEKLKISSKELADLASENIVRERHVAIYKFKTPYVYKQYSLSGFELIEPRNDQTCDSTLDHIEFVLKTSFQEFIEQYPSVNWDTTAMDRSEFPKLSIKFADGTSVKFHPKNILKEIPKV